MNVAELNKPLPPLDTLRTYLTQAARVAGCETGPDGKPAGVARWSLAWYYE